MIIGVAAQDTGIHQGLEQVEEIALVDLDDGRQQVGKGDDRTIERWCVAACAEPRGVAAAVAPAAHEGDEAVVGAVEFLVGRRYGGRAARGVGAEEPFNRGAPAAVGAGAGLGQGGRRGAVEQAANGGVGELAGAIG